MVNQKRRSGRRNAPGWGKLFQGIAQYCSRDVAMVLPQKRFQHRSIPFTNFAQPPAASFVHWIVLINRKVFSQFEGIPKIACANKRKRGEDGDSSVPKRTGSCEFVKYRAIPPEQVRSRNIRSRAVHQVPIIHPCPFFQTWSAHPLFEILVLFLVMSGRAQKGQQALVSVIRIEQPFAICQLKLPERSS